MYVNKMFHDKFRKLLNNKYYLFSKRFKITVLEYYFYFSVPQHNIFLTTSVSYLFEIIYSNSKTMFYLTTYIKFPISLNFPKISSPGVN